MIRAVRKKKGFGPTSQHWNEDEDTVCSQSQIRISVSTEVYVSLPLALQKVRFVLLLIKSPPPQLILTRLTLRDSDRPELIVPADKTDDKKIFKWQQKMNFEDNDIAAAALPFLVFSSLEFYCNKKRKNYPIPKKLECCVKHK